jgi:hypothetical protein
VHRQERGEHAQAVATRPSRIFLHRNSPAPLRPCQRHARPPIGTASKSVLYPNVIRIRRSSRTHGFGLLSMFSSRTMAVPALSSHSTIGPDADIRVFLGTSLSRAVRQRESRRRSIGRWSRVAKVVGSGAMPRGSSESRGARFDRRLAAPRPKCGQSARLRCFEDAAVRLGRVGGRD